MKNLIFVLASILIFSACTTPKKSIFNEKSYRIKEINKQNTWYVIYAEKNGNLYKIVSRPDDNYNSNCNKIIVGKYYVFELKSRKENAPNVNGVKLDPINYTGCYQYDSITTICLEPKRGILDLFYTDDLKGICYLK